MRHASSANPELGREENRSATSAVGRISDAFMETPDAKVNSSRLRGVE